MSSGALVTAPPREDVRRVDVARVGVVVLFTITAGSNVGGLLRHLTGDELLWQRAAAAASSVLSLSFCAIVVFAYLRRGPASATDRGRLVWVVAPLATAVPLVLAGLPPLSGGLTRTAVELGLTLAGLTWSVWALQTLATNISIVPQARGLVTGGPYRWVRHPLYLGELIALSGLALHVGRWPLAAVVLAELGLQMYRARREESLLSQQIDGYAAYAGRTRRLIPGVW
jgi:protein-S-isoprenylcysteine O-methyltransferase Ste14